MGEWVDGRISGGGDGGWMDRRVTKRVWQNVNAESRCWVYESLLQRSFNFAVCLKIL